MYVVVGFHKIKPECVDDYIANIRGHAERSNAEPGCARYEVLRDADDPALFMLYEVFQDEVAFRTHQDSEHHERWMTMSADWREVSPVARYEMAHVYDPLSP